MKKVQEKKDSHLRMLSEGLANENPFLVANSLANLTAGETAEKIRSNWRKEVDLNQALQLLQNNLGYLIGTWLDYYEQQLRILQFDGGLEYEEMMQVLTLQSSLHNVWAFIPSEDKTRLKEEYHVNFERLLELLEKRIQEHKEHWNSCISRNTLGFFAYNHEHWWWHSASR